MKSSFFAKYLLPGFVFQSLIIGGGYGTGRELVEFFLSRGPLGGLLAMTLVTTLIWSAVCAASFEFARVFRSYQYRHFFQHLLGRAWITYEIAFVLLAVIVLAVIGAAAGTLMQENFGIPELVGVMGMMAVVGVLVFFGTSAIEKFLAGWSFILYAVYIVLFVWAFTKFGDAIKAGLTSEPVGTSWVLGGISYAGYNLASIPVMLFVVRHIESRKEAVGAGIMAGIIGIVPAILFYLGMVGLYPAVLERPVPANFLLEALGSRAFQLTFQVVLFGTLIETGTGFIHGFNERVASVYADRKRDMPRFLRPTIALTALVVATVLSRIGIIGLIAKGYGILTWVFILCFVIPILTWGVWKIRNTVAPSPEEIAQEPAQ